MLLLAAAFAFQTAQANDYSKDLDVLISRLKSDGAYVLSDKINFARLENTYRPRLAAAKTAKDCLPILEAFIAELHDFHATLGSNTQTSPRLVPSGTDIIAYWKDDRAFVEQIKPASLADKARILPGDEILQVDGKRVRLAARAWFGALPSGTRGWSWALNSAIAGRWNRPRKLKLRRNGKDRELTLATATNVRSTNLLTLSYKPGGIVALRIEDSLGEAALLKGLVHVLPDLRKADGIILDLRNTPSGGNAAVARGLMAHFIQKRLPFQRHIYEERDTGTVRDWIEYATPTTGEPIKGKLVVLVSRWTGSMGEGLAIGFDGMKRGTVIGTAMAGLRGAVAGVTLPASGLRVFFPTERLYHINGIPRHQWMPRIIVQPGIGDPWMLAAEKFLQPEPAPVIPGAP